MNRDNNITIQVNSVDNNMEKLFSSIQEKIQEKLAEIAKKQAEQLENCKGVKARFKRLEIVE